MNFLGMGPMELVLIMILALIFVGPSELPKIARQLGQMVGEFRRTTSDMTAEFQRSFSLEQEEDEAPAAPVQTVPTASTVGTVAETPALPEPAPIEPVSPYADLTTPGHEFPPPAEATIQSPAPSTTLPPTSTVAWPWEQAATSPPAPVAWPWENGNGAEDTAPEVVEQLTIRPPAEARAGEALPPADTGEQTDTDEQTATDEQHARPAVGKLPETPSREARGADPAA
ncbi:MAG: twin-arginine translocase TatA/TatE family subunit [Chloroflexi bacterium]|nr:twin-arginine translocase TatA/TatE family subunit [Chloroflexota bacterium]